MKNENQTKLMRINAQTKAAFDSSIGACRNLAAKFSQLKDRLIQRLTGEVNSHLPGGLLARAIGEAEALAWTTPYPLLFLPALAEEKVLSARQWAEHQRQILNHQRQARSGNW